MQMELKDSKSSAGTTNNGTNNSTAENNTNEIKTKPVPTAAFLHQVLNLGAKNSTTDTRHYTPTIALGTNIEDTSLADSAPNTNNSAAHGTAHTLKRPRDSEGTSEPAPKRVKGHDRFQRTEAEELDGPISHAVPWCGVEVTRVRVRVNLVALQLPLYRKYFGTSVAPRYELLNKQQAEALALQACQSLTCTVEWANDTRQRSQDLAWQITPRDSAHSTATVTLAPRTMDVHRGADWLLEADFAGFRARIRAPLRVRVSRATATGEHVLLDVTLGDTCWHQSVTPFTLTQHVTEVTLGDMARYYHEPRVHHCLTRAADTSVTPATPELELTFLAVSQMTELLNAGRWITEKTPDQGPAPVTAVLDEVADML